MCTRKSQSVSGVRKGSVPPAWTSYMARALWAIPAVLFCVLSGLPGIGWSSVVDTGDVQLNGNDLNIGNTADGRRDVFATTDSHDNTSLGNAANITGTLNVSNIDPSGPAASALYSNTFDLIVGNLGIGALTVTGSTVTSNRIVAGKNPGSSGTINDASGHISTSGPGNTIIVGDAGTGVLTGPVSTQRLLIANQPLSNGTVGDLPGLPGSSSFSGTISGIDTGGYLGIGVGGVGSLQANSPYSIKYAGTSGLAYVNVGGPGFGPSVEVGVNSGSTGVAGGSGLSINVAGQSARLIVGKYGDGRINMGTSYDTNRSSYATSVSVSDSVTSDAQVIVAQYPGSIGVISMSGVTYYNGGSGSAQLNAGNALRIGLDEYDNNGGTGSVGVYGGGSVLTAGVIKIGPTGKLAESFDGSLYSYNQGLSKIVGNIINRGQVSLYFINPQGSFTNSGVLTFNGSPLPFSGPSQNTFTGNFVQDSAGVLNKTVNFDYPSNPQQINVTGTAQLDGTIAIHGSFTQIIGGIATHGSYPASAIDATIRILTATGGAGFAPTLNVVFPELPAGWTAIPLFDATGMSVRFVSPPMVDLATSMTASGSESFQGQLVTYNITVTNIGLAPATGVTVSGTLPTCNIGNLASGAAVTCPISSVTATTVGYLNQTMTASSTETDQNLANNSASVSTIIYGSAYSLSLTTTGFGSGTVSGAGTYPYGTIVAVDAIADPGSSFAGWSGPDGAECMTLSVLITANKSCTATFTLIVAADLTPAALAASLSGSSLIIKDSVKNQGTAAAGAFRISYYLSADSTYDAGDALVCGRNVSSLAVGASNPAKGTTSTTCALPAVTAGAYYVLAVDDSGNVITETNESNNVRATSTTVSLGADLTPTAVSASKSSSKVPVSDTVKNQGTANVSSAFTVSYYLSTDTSYQAGTDIALASSSGGSGMCTRNITSLKAGASNSGGATCYKPTAAKNGVKYYVLVVDDAGNVIGEYNESNNVKATGGTISW